MSEQWYYAEGNKRVGPLSFEELKRKLTAFAKPWEILVWHSGLSGWTAAGFIPELVPHRTPPPLPPNRHSPHRVLIAIAILIVCILVGYFTSESDEARKSRLAQSEGISSAVYDARVRDFGSYDNYKEAAAKNLNARQYAEYLAQKRACKGDWKQCADNRQLANEWGGWSNVKVNCKIAADKRARYGDPEWPWLSFSTFLTGKSYIDTGKAVAIEPNAKFPNAFNAKVRVEVSCFYDLRADRVEDILISESGL